MKKKIAELDVDFIGEQGKSLTKEEEQAISKYLKHSKESRDKSQRRKRQTKARSKTER